MRQKVVTIFPLVVAVYLFILAILCVIVITTGSHAVDQAFDIISLTGSYCLSIFLVWHCYYYCKDSRQREREQKERWDKLSKEEAAEYDAFIKEQFPDWEPLKPFDHKKARIESIIMTSIGVGIMVLYTIFLF